MKWWGNWLTVLGQGCKLKLLTTLSVGTTAPLFLYTLLAVVRLIKH